MSFSENANGMVMPVSPMYGGYGGNGGFSFGDGSGAWFLLFLIAMMGGWGNGFGGFGGNGAMPYVMGQNTNNDVQRGFDQSAVMSGINGINNAVVTGFGNVQTSLCNGFAGVNQGVSNGFAQAEIANNARQIADMQQAFAAQTAMSQGFNQLGSQFANCCCENRLAVANLGSDIAREACADRQATSDAMMAIANKIDALGNQLTMQNYQNQIAQKDDIIAQLRSEAMYARGQASQDVQTAAIQAGQRALANEVEQYVLPTPRPAYIVQNPNCCQQNYGGGYGM